MRNAFATIATRAVIAPRATTAATRFDRKTIDRKTGTLVKTGTRMGLEMRSA
jgi:hypothetical protein